MQLEFMGFEKDMYHVKIVQVKSTSAFWTSCRIEIMIVCGINDRMTDTGPYSFRKVAEVQLCRVKSKFGWMNLRMAEQGTHLGVRKGN